MSRAPHVSPPRSGPPQGDQWLDSVKQAFRDVESLCAYLALPGSAAESARAGARDFRLFVPREFAVRMRPGDINDPLLRQVLPVEAEGQDLAGELGPAGGLDDPVGDGQSAVRPGLLHKYQRRVLLVTTGACAVHCRYCFRRHFPYHQSPPQPSTWDGALDYLAEHPEVDEVILSGGDPLMLTDATLSQLVGRLESLAHVRRLRIHTRLPIVIPARVQLELLGWLSETRLATTVVVHANHPQELDDAVWEALGRLVGAGIPVLNQAVLLRGINDRPEVLETLCRELVNHRVMPYYLSQLDRVRGAAHFEVPESTGRELIGHLRRTLPGYAVPRYVREVAGSEFKLPLE